MTPQVGSYYITLQSEGRMESKTRLHDATLVSIEMNWAAKTTIVAFRTSSDSTVNLIASGSRNAFIPHDEPWGPSVSVNGVREIDGDSDVNAVEIEMQSGDVIRIEAGSFVWS